MEEKTKKRLYTPAFQTPLPEEEFESAEKPDEDKNSLQKLLKPVYGSLIKNRAVETNAPSQTYDVPRKTIKATPVGGSLLKRVVKETAKNIYEGVEGTRDILEETFLSPTAKEEKRLHSLLTKPTYLISPEQQKAGFVLPKEKEEDFITIDKKKFLTSKDPELFSIGIYAPKKVLKTQIGL